MRTNTVRLSKILAAGAAVAFGATAALPAAASTAAATGINWGQDGFNKADSGYNAFETSITPATVTNLRWQWSITSPVAQPSCPPSFSGQRAPIVDNGHLALTDQGGFAVYDATTGAQQWNWRSPDAGEGYGPLLAASGTTLVAVEQDCRSESSPATPLTVFDLATGTQLWHVFPDLPITSYAIDGSVIVTTGSDVEGAVTRGYSLTTGAVQWERPDVSAAIAADFGGKVLVSGAAGSMAINVTTGATVWSTATPWTALAATADGTRVAVTDDAGDLAYLNGATGAVVWSKPNLADAPYLFNGGTKVALDGTRVYTEHSGTLYALNPTTGATLWSAVIGTGAARPVVAGGVVYAPVAGQFGEMRVINAATGATLNDEEPWIGITAHAVVVNGWLYVTTGRVLDAYKL